MITEKETVIEKWIWKMDYCKSIGFPPAHKWAWDKAEITYQKQLEENKTKMENSFENTN
jgi:hypothetical protein